MSVSNPTIKPNKLPNKQSVVVSRPDRNAVYCEHCEVSVKYFKEHCKTLKHINNTGSEQNVSYYRKQYNQQYYQKNKETLRQEQKKRYQQKYSNLEYCADCDIWIKNWNKHTVRKNHIKNKELRHYKQMSNELEAMQKRWNDCFYNIK